MSNKNSLTRTNNKAIITAAPARDNNNTGVAGRLVEQQQDDLVTERHYGCYRLGLVVALIIIFILMIGSVPVFVTTDNSKLILIVLIITLIIVGILTFAYFEWQRRLAIRMRQNSLRGVYNTTTIERRSLEQQKYASAKKKQDGKKQVMDTTKYSPV